MLFRVAPGLVVAPAKSANGRFVSTSRSLRSFVFNEIGSFVPLKKVWVPPFDSGKSIYCGCQFHSPYIGHGRAFCLSSGQRRRAGSARNQTVYRSNTRHSFGAKCA